MEDNVLKKYVKNFKEVGSKYPYQLFSIIIFLLTLSWGFHAYQYEQKEQRLIENYNKKDNDLDLRYQDRKETLQLSVDSLRDERDKYMMESIQCNSDSEYINISISNSNAENNQILYNATCIDKDYTISRLVKRLKEKDQIINDSIEDINKLNNNISFLEIEIDKRDEIIGIDVDNNFVGIEIQQGEGGNFYVDNGKFSLITRDIYFTNGNNDWVDITLLGVNYRQSEGSKRPFTYEDTNYTLTVLSIGNSVKYIINEEI